jgi:hypothetical protein
VEPVILKPAAGRVFVTGLIGSFADRKEKAAGLVKFVSFIEFTGHEG